MLGLRPGKPGGYVGKEYVPPRGAALRIELRWKDKTGESHSAEASDWLKLSGRGTGKVKPTGWIFVGSEILPGGVYDADLNGGIIAVANLPSAVIDVPFESTQTMENREFVVDAIWVIYKHYDPNIPWIPEWIENKLEQVVVGKLAEAAVEAAYKMYQKMKDKDEE